MSYFRCDACAHRRAADGTPTLFAELRKRLRPFRQVLQKHLLLALVGVDDRSRFEHVPGSRSHVPVAPSIR